MGCNKKKSCCQLWWQPLVNTSLISQFGENIISFNFLADAILMDKIIKNKRRLELLTSCSSGYKTSSEKFLYYLFYLSDQVWWCNMKWFLSYSKNFICKFIQAKSCIMNYSTSICTFESGKFGKDGKKSQKFEYLEKEKSFLDEIKNIFNSFWRPIIWWKNKNLIENRGHKL